LARRRAPKAYCKGAEVSEEICATCGREVRVKNDGTAYKHYPLRDMTRTDKKHSTYIEKTYGITGDQYEALLAHQGGVCFICQKRPVSKRLAVDHDHRSGVVRGLLCRRDNHRLLGSANDDVAVLLRAVEYLNNPPAFSCFDEPIIRKESSGTTQEG
jgi:hypothetical protein